ncbi:MAG: hypothetical protein ABJG78_12650 [Cyclobacteriaceae bacterium]
MDPTLFNLDWERLFQALAVVIVLAFVLERALSVIFENKYLAPFFERVHIKELIALGLGFGVVKTFGFDMVSIVLLGDENTNLGYGLTAAIIAGGSKASIKLFVDIWKIGNKIKNDEAPEVPEENQQS